MNTEKFRQLTKEYTASRDLQGQICSLKENIKNLERAIKLVTNRDNPIIYIKTSMGTDIIKISDNELLKILTENIENYNRELSILEKQFEGL
jgi:tRNA threonylcarbamoyladenosine modification (KEOPS) complex Cgi121 subunit